MQLTLGTFKIAVSGIAAAWRSRSLRIFAGVVTLVPIAAFAFGQTQDASIIGQVRDESGAVLPGVTVTATSPALQVPSIVVVTNELGEYRMSPLPIGTYRRDLHADRDSRRSRSRTSA